MGNRWIEAKSGWNIMQPESREFGRFQATTGQQKRIAEQNKATLEIHSNVPIPQHVKDWLDKKEISYVEHLE